MPKDERDPGEETPSVEPTDEGALDATPHSDHAGADDAGDDRFDESGADAEVEIDDRDALERATERVSDHELDEDDELVEEPTDDELNALTEPVDEREQSDDDDERSDDDGSRSDGELVGVGAATRRSKAKGAEQSVTKKGRATPKRDGGGSGAQKRTGPVTFVKESVGELRKVVYPTGPQLLNYWIVVLIFVLFIIAFVSVLDLAFGWAILKVFS